MDAKGMPTTLGSILFKNYFPDRDSFVAEKLRKAGAIILAKTTFGELGGGDTHGSLFGSTRNPYGLDLTAGGSSGGSGAGISANFATVSVGQEAFASIARSTRCEWVGRCHLKLARRKCSLTGNASSSFHAEPAQALYNRSGKFLLECLRIATPTAESSHPSAALCRAQ
jgi:Asp-tRNA(Asn)/Glu-tRNA(Gln) amidotransferase A subunit family amidase